MHPLMTDILWVCVLFCDKRKKMKFNFDTAGVRGNLARESPLVSSRWKLNGLEKFCVCLEKESLSVSHCVCVCVRINAATAAFSSCWLANNLWLELFVWSESKRWSLQKNSWLICCWFAGGEKVWLEFN